MNSLVSVIILNYKHYQDTISCLKSILKSSYAHYNIILVDNNSPNESVTELTKWIFTHYGDGVIDKTEEVFFTTVFSKQFLPKLTFIVSSENKGYAAGNNIGIRYAANRYGTEYFWILNNDTVVDRFAMQALVDSLEYEPKAGITSSVLLEFNQREIVQAVGGQYFKWTGRNKSVGRGLNYQAVKEHTFSIDYPNGASMMVRRSFVESVGLMNEEYFLYFEEIDWVIRGNEKDWHVTVAMKSKVWHKEGGTVSAAKNERSALSDYFIARSRLLFTRRFFPAALPTVYLGMTVFVVNRLKRRQAARLPLLFRIFFNPSLSTSIIMDKI